MPSPQALTLIDSVNELDIPTGVVPRGAVFENRAGFRVAHIFVFNSSGDLLLQQVGRTRQRSPYRWGSSVATYLNAGESYAEAARRRLYEELLLQTELRKLGSTRMHDDGASKFIELFETKSDFAEIGEPDHIDALEFVPVPVVQDLLSSDPHRFTETFPFVFRLFQAVSGLR